MSKNGCSISDRMKGYENISRIYLTKRSPVIIRIDGKSFHNFTRGLKRPFDGILMNAMAETAKYLCENITGCKLAYTQSDEISLLLTDYDTIECMPWFENNLQKLVSISASMATLAFNRAFAKKCDAYFECDKNSAEPDDKAYRAALKKALDKGAVFDSRAFVLPKDEVINYFIWRQQDATRNSILMVAQSLYSHKELQGIKCDALQDKMFTERGVNWNDCTIAQKRGTCVIRQAVQVNNVERRKWIIDLDIPIFSKNKDYVNSLVFAEAKR